MRGDGRGYEYGLSAGSNLPAVRYAITEVATLLVPVGRLRTGSTNIEKTGTANDTVACTASKICATAHATSIETAIAGESRVT